MQEEPGKPSPRDGAVKHQHTGASRDGEQRLPLQVLHRPRAQRQRGETNSWEITQADRQTEVRCEGGRDGAGTRPDGSAGKAKRWVRKGGRGTST